MASSFAHYADGCRAICRGACHLAAGDVSTSIAPSAALPPILSRQAIPPAIQLGAGVFRGGIGRAPAGRRIAHRLLRPGGRDLGEPTPAASARSLSTFHAAPW